MLRTSCACTDVARRSACCSAAIASRCAALSEHDARERVKQREVSPVARGVQRRRGFGDVLADDGRVADLFVAVAELVVREADGF